MVTCRQIQELTKARLEGSVPSYPEQWIEGPMARRDRAMMRRGMLRRRLPKVKGAAKKAARSPSPPGSAGNGRPPSPNRGHVPMRGPKTQVLGSGKASGEGDEPTSLALPLKPLRWPRVRDEQLQTVCSIKRMLKELHAYLQANSSTLVEALPRRSVNGEGFVSIVTLHHWLCSLKREPGNGPTGVEGLRLSLTPDAETIRSRALAVRSQYHGRAKKEGFRRAAECKTDDSDALAASEFHKLLLQAKVSLTFEQVKKLVAYLDTDGSGKIEHDELQAAILDYRRFKRAKQRLELKRASAERRLFLDRQVLLLLQYLVLVGEGNKLKDQQYQAYATAALGNANANEAKDEALRETMAQVGPNGPHDQFINVVDMQRAIEKSSNLAIAQYFREVRERLHSDAYQQLREINN